MASESKSQYGRGGAWETASVLEHTANIPVFSEAPHIFRKTSIICTIGPKTNTPEALLKLRKAGMNITRMNFSHGSYDYHKSVINNLHKSFELEDGPVVAIALDTKGPEIRTGLMKDDQDVELKAGSIITVSVDPKHKECSTADLLYMDYSNLCKVVAVGGRIFVDDGLICLKVVSKAADQMSVQCEIVNSGTIASRRGVNLPGTIVDLPAVSEKDKKDLQFGIEQGVDMVFASFIRKAKDIHDIRAILGDAGKNVKIISKIESQEGVDNFDSILEATDGVMVARGDLGIEIPAAKVFLAQKMMISKCNMAGKPIICATQMLESMIVNPRPTRAEVTDVANAVLDGADCVMLSGETAKGAYPFESVSTMDDICTQAELAFHYRAFFNDLTSACNNLGVSEAVSAAAVSAAANCNASAMIVLTNSGKTARLVSKYRPRVPIVVVTTVTQTARQCHLYRGCFGIKYTGESKSEEDWFADRECRVKFGLDAGKSKGFVQDGDKVVVILGTERGHGNANSFRIVEVSTANSNSNARGPAQRDSQ
mmetsp:Transcript_10938/g.20801  ORF Transcript_10938/g.20801 Transcript_10938/m.20801 type:complete len:540 (-) Transcript_10938:203-1822(-)|eukprot:CAMPEP_0175144760 /NCGR_PEP_ID=MMETSP0087-20121206/14342_1 /TAXON_ID=136419 /ORGANISM="Unknown Unknown, Strain D1" /LENGTH=539 /DNA_ID=CAMNT_0016429327 /DNA_START=36 /DNA_END=1655 /DNA_ORIENTATION=+